MKSTRSLEKGKASLAVVLLVASFFWALCAGCAGDANSASQEKDPVIYVSGGAIDDFTASMLAISMDGVDYRGTVVSNSDCIYNFAMQCQWRVQSFIKKTDLPIYLSTARGWNPFPIEYRSDCLTVYNSSILDGYADNADWPPFSPGEAFLAEELSRAIDQGTPLTVLIPSAITPLATVLQADPGLEQGIKRVVWMGGAIDVPGNLDPTTLPAAICNDKAEWNVFWDPYAVDWIFRNTSFPLILFPLDVTNEAKITQDFLDRLAEQAKEYDYSNLMHGLYALVRADPYYDMWNTLTTAYIARPDIFEDPVEMSLGVVTEGFMQGALTQVEDGREVLVFLNVKAPDLFYDYVLSQMRRNAE